MNSARLPVLLILIFAFLPSMAQVKNFIAIEDPGKLIEKVNSFSEKTNTITADFIQVKEMSFMEETVTASGRFYFRKEKQLRWEYVDPFRYTIILNNERIRIMDEGKARDFEAGSNRIFLEISEVMAGLVNGTLPGSSRFNSSWFESDDCYKVELVPADSGLKEYLSRIELQLNKTDYSADVLKLYEKSGDFTQIRFNNKKWNEDIPDEIFNLD